MGETGGIDMSEWGYTPMEREVWIGPLRVLLREHLDCSDLLRMKEVADARERLRHLFTLDGEPVSLADGEARLYSLLADHAADPPLPYDRVVSLSRTWGVDCLSAAAAALELLTFDRKARPETLDL